MFRTIRTSLALLVMAAVFPWAGPSFAATPVADELAGTAKSSGKPLIADFGLGFCRQCKMQSETLERVRRTYGERLTIRMVDAAKEQGLMSRYGVEVVPTVIFFDSEGEVVLRKVGPMEYDAVREQLSRMGVE